ncbi:MAG TPA: hypothetical protein VHJ83_01270 [Micromonosporaceae bacterium]|jgi:hypothetical protein|nr:hypothetical protein [Micromonosporaceae bacterium]
MKLIRRTALVALGSAAVLVLSAGPSLAHECVNASKKDQSAGAQAVIDLTTGQVVWSTPGLANRFAQGLVDPNTGEGFHGLIGFDLDGDGIADVSTFIVGPEDEIPEIAQTNGPACSGITNIGTYFTECLG